MNRREPGRILVYMPSWVGDVVMATPALRALRTRFSKSHITLLVRPNTLEVLSGGPWMDEVTAWQPGRGGWAAVITLWHLVRRIRAGRYDLAVLLSNSWRSALAVRLGGVGQRVGYRREGRGWLLTAGPDPPRDGRQLALISAVHYYNRLVELLGCAPPGERLELGTTAADEAAVEQRLRGWGLAGHHPLVVINPGAAYGPAKLWPPERFGAVGERLVRERGAAVVITFGPGEEDLARRVGAAMSVRSFLVDQPRGTLGQLKVLIKRCDLLLNNDTGPRHFAKAFQRAVVTVFGPTFPEWTHTDYARERIVRIAVDCGPCQLKVCPLDHRCMTGVTEDMVFGAATELLDAAGQGGHY